MELDPEEVEALREKSSTRAATSNGRHCCGMLLRPITMATFVILQGTGNGFWREPRKRLAAFDAAAFVWLHAAPEAEVFTCDWQDPREFTIAVTNWMRQFSGAQIREFATVAKEERDAYLSSEFRVVEDPLLGASGQKKSKSGPGERSAT